ncbi:hypothetical protein J3B02_000573 [Coemansia erecta]|nr:hypothetical protein J3B02_000573 [Coemansia erecta]
MLSPIELLGVIGDIKRVAESAPPEDSIYGSEDEDQTENNFELRDYDIDALHADDARDKVFVAILKALVARHNKPSSPKELANCIMKNEFTILGGATPYATVSSRISQHFKRILEHTPPRPPILGRIAHEKHTRKYFYYVASAQEQEDFLHKVRIGLIPTHSTASANGSGGKDIANGCNSNNSNNNSNSSSGKRKTKTTKKIRCMVPAVAVEPDLSPVAAVRRGRRAASADTVVGTGMQAIGRSALQSEGGVQRRSSSRQMSLSIGSSNTRPRRTSYDGGSHRISGLQNGKDLSDSDSDSNPYARKRYKSVKSAVALAHPRRRSRVQADLASERRGRASVPTVVSAMAPRARRSASYGDTQTGTLSRSSSRREVSQSSSGAGKWRPSYTSDEDAHFQSEKNSGLNSSSSSDHGIAHGESDSDSGSSDRVAGRQSPSYENESLSASSSGFQGSDNRLNRVDRSSSASGGRILSPPSLDATMLVPPVPNTTPRASASPDITPFPPATSPSFHPHCLDGDSDENSNHNANSNNNSNSFSELQVASPLLLPRGLMALQMPLESIFGSSPVVGKDSIPSPADMLTPVVAASSVLLHPEDSVVPVTHSPTLISAGKF